MEAIIPIAFIVFIPGIIALAFFLSWQAEKKRRATLAGLADKQGLRYEQEDQGQLAPYGFRLFERGRSKRSTNHMIGDGEGLKVLVADYRYTTGSGKNSSTHHQTVCVVSHELADLPVCLLRRQVSLFDALGKLFGGQDIDFDDDADFSKRFVLQGDVEERVREAFGPGVRAWCLQQNDNLQVECGGSAILVHYGRRLKPDQIIDLIRTASTLMGHWLRPPWLKTGPTSDDDDDDQGL